MTMRRRKNASETRKGASGHVSKLARDASETREVTWGHGDKGRGKGYGVNYRDFILHNPI